MPSHTPAHRKAKKKKMKLKGIAIKAGVSRNGRKYIVGELEKAAPSLKDKPILKDHNPTVDNTVGRTTEAVFNDDAIEFEGYIIDDSLAEKIEAGVIKEVSIGAYAKRLVKENEDDDVVIPVDMEFAELSFTPTPGVQGAMVSSYHENTIQEVPLTRKAINNLPDSAFAVIKPGGKKDEDGKTVPRGLRKFPFKKADGSMDLPRLRNALARIEQSPDLTPSQIATVRRKLQAAAKTAGVGEFRKEESMEEKMDENLIREEVRKELETEFELKALTKDYSTLCEKVGKKARKNLSQESLEVLIEDYTDLLKEQEEEKPEEEKPKEEEPAEEPKPEAEEPKGEVKKEEEPAAVEGEETSEFVDPKGKEFRMVREANGKISYGYYAKPNTFANALRGGQ